MICIAALVCTVFAQSNSDLFLPNNFPGRIDITRVDTDISKNTLPKDFLWGFASAAVQNEGSASADGKSDSIWDVYARIPGKILNGTTPEVAVDEYVRYKETTQLLKEAGATAYRLSISWPRLIPGGHRGSPVNQLAVQHYNDVFDDLISNGITPLVTLYHWDLPQVLDSSYGGLLNATEFPQDYAYFADKAFEAFGEKVKLWLTFNEPISSCAFGYGIGMHAPGRCPDRKKCKEGNGMGEVLQCGHSILLAHAKAVDIYRKKYQNIQEGQISIAPNSEWAQPMNPDNSFDRFFAQAKMDFMLGWFADPIFLTGRYPLLMRAALFSQLPWFTSEESKMLKGSADFFAINHYSTTLVTNPLHHSANAQGGNESSVLPWTATWKYGNGSSIGDEANGSWLHNVPWGMGQMLRYIKQRYNDPEIFIAENGFSVKGEAEMDLPSALGDAARIDYFKGYLDSMKQAINESKCRVKGYIAWSLMDNFEWAVGFSDKFGAVHVDMDTQVRTKKASFYYLKRYFGISIKKE